MGYNKAKAENDWLRWKEAEERKLRALGVDEEVIQKLRLSDWEDFKAERVYWQWQESFSEYLDSHMGRYDQENSGMDEANLLNSIENKDLLKVLLTVDKVTLKIIICKIQGYSSKEIAKRLQMNELAVNQRIYRLRKKIKKYF